MNKVSEFTSFRLLLLINQWCFDRGQCLLNEQVWVWLMKWFWGAWRRGVHRNRASSVHPQYQGWITSLYCFLVYRKNEIDTTNWKQINEISGHMLLPGGNIYVQFNLKQPLHQCVLWGSATRIHTAFKGKSLKTLLGFFGFNSKDPWV